jgi:DNA-binding GntR family transcriptional regulator
VPEDQSLLRGIEGNAYALMRKRIIEGSLAPGSPLALADVAKELDVSTMPVRSALNRLKSEGLVRQLRNRVSIVAPLELEDFEEIQAVRSGSEAFAAHLGVAQVTSGDILRMQEMLRTLREVSAAERLTEYLDLEWEFHAVCYRAAGRIRLLRLVEDWRRRAERYIRLSIASSPGFSQSIGIQERLLALAEARDGEAAEALIRAALAKSVQQVETILRCQ